jgi:hypothetical protein
MGFVNLNVWKRIWAEYGLPALPIVDIHKIAGLWAGFIAIHGATIP